jgi:hypothetical protein
MVFRIQENVVMPAGFVGRVWQTVKAKSNLATAERTMLRLRADGRHYVRRDLRPVYCVAVRT